MTQTTFAFTTDYKNEFKHYVDDLFTRVKYDEKTGGELAFKTINRPPQAGDYVILRGDSTPVKYDEETHFESEITTVLVPDRTKRIALIDELIESYITATGQRPDNVQLDRLATLCLREELTDSTPYKVRNTEYPISSERQELEYMKKRVPVEAAQNYAADGENWNAPYRRKRSKAENAYMDRNYGKSRKKKV